ncbi:MAG TPA: hypothetical protein VI259_17755 [Gemmatimonadaceae bacterium]
MTSPTNEQGSPDSSVIIPAGPRRERLKFADFVFARTPSGQCTAEVHLEFDGVLYVGRALGQSSLLGDFRVAAEAALHALADYTKGAMHFDLLGVKHLRAFDENLIIVSISMREPSRMVKLVGCALAETDTRRCAALAVLNATNRVLGNYIAAQ